VGGSRAGRRSRKSSTSILSLAHLSISSNFPEKYRWTYLITRVHVCSGHRSGSVGRHGTSSASSGSSSSLIISSISISISRGAYDSSRPNDSSSLSSVLAHFVVRRNRGRDIQMDHK
jgi:hypothetical protein